MQQRSRHLNPREVLDIILFPLQKKENILQQKDFFKTPNRQPAKNYGRSRYAAQKLTENRFPPEDQFLQLLILVFWRTEQPAVSPEKTKLGAVLPLALCTRGGGDRRGGKGEIFLEKKEDQCRAVFGENQAVRETRCGILARFLIQLQAFYRQTKGKNTCFFKFKIRGLE